MSKPSSDTTFAADASILGFKYQIRYALFAFFEAERRFGRDVSIDVEKIDDIDVRFRDRVTTVIQTKNSATVLTNSSAPFWKTVRVWSSAIRKGQVDPASGIRFQLVSTGDATAADSSIISQLIANTKKTRLAALEQMRLLAAAKRDQATLGSAYREFLALHDDQQEQRSDSDRLAFLRRSKCIRMKSAPVDLAI